MKAAIDILAFGAHADDVEIGMGGSIAKWASQGKSVVICDLTEAELSSNGTVASRKAEAKKAAELLGVKERVGLTIPDRGLFLRDEYIKEVVEIIRKYRPVTVFAPFFEDRHPDHGHCGRLVEEAFFSSGIRKYAAEQSHEYYRPQSMYYYMINGFHHPDFVVDVTNQMDLKIKSLNAYESQFQLAENGIKTPLTEGYIETVKARERLFGKEVNVEYAEGFLSKKPLLVDLDVINEWKRN
jgi:bacillithiol biosynthesis deacetylase BshB1